MKRENKNNEKGFTLIEIVVTLILVGILGVIGSIGLVNMVKGYVAAKANATAVQKGQVALLQIGRLLTYSSAISPGATNSSITFDSYVSGSPTVTTNTLSFNNGVVSLQPGAGVASDPLIDQVQQFKMGFYDNYNATEQATWTSGSSKIIEITIRLNLGQGEVSPEFKTRIIPRNVIYSQP